MLRALPQRVLDFSRRSPLVCAAMLIGLGGAVSAAASLIPRRGPDLIPGMSFPPPYADKVGHFLLSGTIVWLLLHAAEKHLHFRGRLVLATTVVLALVILEESLQALSPRRTFSLADLAASVSGIGVFGLLALRSITRMDGRNTPNG